jgi:predicted metalloprotease with PDZ domain
LAYTDTLPETLKGRGMLDLSYSLGCWLSKDGSVLEVIPHSIAGKAGLTAGMRVIAVNGRRFSDHSLRQGLRAATNKDVKLEFLIENGDEFKTYSIDYHGGEKYPNLESLKDRPDVLSEIIKPIREKRINHE